MSENERVWLLMAKKMTQSIEHSELKELEEILANNPELWYSFEMLEASNELEAALEKFMTEPRALLQSANASFKEDVIATVSDKSAKSTTTFASIKMVMAIAFAVVISLIGFFNYDSLKVYTLSMNEIITPRGTKSQLQLPDGTKIILNAGSKLQYSKHYGKSEREVYLTGEAYFEVKHDAKRPFIVHTSQADIKDLGTIFNVKAFDELLETILVEGVVEIYPKKMGQKKIRMMPLEKVVITTAWFDKGPEISVVVPDVQTKEIVETAWINDKLIFRDKRFEDLSKELERRFNVKIYFKRNAIKEYRLTGVFTNENINEAMSLLKVIANINYTINEDEIIIE
ncbi:anti-FecI sigma factor, FecR [Arcticibacter svalbardensis MN12-7]|uniref:Anti-FecI sigma factor, FecR n=1 Tax=Arcticibacter svalbardensis MN12-7 TaxID=1150600 RepID=R9GQW7_9SPHI|nr:FecR domain-containing protein [Arcticibacter svalbardensis]EOR94212.1 anti-FecI sigma factor, FecR [Arcticibacter svalbardensis MN12-7]